MVIFGFGQFSDAIGKIHRLLVIIKAKGFFQFLQCIIGVCAGDYLPANQLLKIFGKFVIGG